MKRICIFVIQCQQSLAPLWRGLLGGSGPCCRFHPTCSAYAIEAIEKHGVAKGLRFALLRVAKCHPWGRSGWDPVKEIS
ncbi:MAG: hypothetical protein ABS33_03745 [Verrucomicrobia subdivision 6 bacterium BACL9 MAG-120924-bin69]|jgi:uncharacterized protein|uniref:Putative membrane protein insertion efficiency factor n=1 Tax=Verrucomicrobia subdivision 6 bacterium BACL9 MAG-120924-bin69 TaxID=1655635 RepID=A0A0R2XC07_9BACT|nr:MAG: hypothetical protein ABS33_03745 [Verrucomicrobia subdivision 6 bacterium BACL9 MAG-120924-bin69]HCP06505.1 membrane protein insertion efficiency factor YidD [Verrucomicrobiales bacterium]